MPPRRPVKPVRRSPWPLVGLALVVIGLLVWLLYPRQATPPTPETLPSEDPVAAWSDDGEHAGPLHPIGSTDAEEDDAMYPLPGLGESDAAMFDALARLLDRAELESLVVPEFIIQRVVASVDNLPRRSLPARMHPVRPTPGTFQVAPGEPPRLAAENHARYAARLSQLESVGTGPLVDLYVRWYPAFQQAYRELGYPDAHFNDRLVEVIDHLLQAPDVDGLPELVRTERGYAFADPRLEEASVGHRALFRLGPENARRLKAWLEAFRAEVTGRTPEDGPRGGQGAGGR